WPSGDSSAGWWPAPTPWTTVVERPARLASRITPTPAASRPARSRSAADGGRRSGCCCFGSSRPPGTGLVLLWGFGRASDGDAGELVALRAEKRLDRLHGGLGGPFRALLLGEPAHPHGLGVLPVPHLVEDGGLRHDPAEVAGERCVGVVVEPGRGRRPPDDRGPLPRVEVGDRPDL